MNLEQKYKSCCNEYIKAFEKKQDLEFDFWIGQEVGSYAVFNEMHLDLRDIRYDIDNKIQKGYIIDWYYYEQEFPESISYKNYLTLIKGLKK